ncbi:MAG: hypothetical protein KKB50_06050 [Planctomycetes bacterium]|nr:hypothetical protein [Planctomycetota bacterium]
MQRSERRHRCRRSRAYRAAVLLSVIAFGGLTFGCAATAGAPEMELSPAQCELNARSFEQAWRTIRDMHWDPSLGGLDWSAVRAELRPQIAQARTMSAARAVMRDMIGRLGQSHFAVVPAEVYEDLRYPVGQGEGDGTAGLDLRVIEGEALVVAVEPDSAAAELGVTPGWQVRTIAGEEVAPLIAGIQQAYADSTAREMRLARSILARLADKVGETRTVSFGDNTGTAVELELTLQQRKGRRVRLGNLPPMYVWLESRQLDGNVGYVTFNVFADPNHLMEEFAQALREFSGCAGIIIDLRGNPGGIGAMAMGIAGWFVDEAGQQLGTMWTRNARINFAIHARAETYAGPLAILVDGLSASTSEILVGGMQDIGRARVFGTTTAGAALPSMFEKLPNGDVLQYAHADYVSAAGGRLEGAGVTPDEEITLDGAALRAGRDPVLEAALKWIESQSRAEAASAGENNVVMIDT